MEKYSSSLLVLSPLQDSVPSDEIASCDAKTPILSEGKVSTQVVSQKESARTSVHNSNASENKKEFSNGNSDGGSSGSNSENEKASPESCDEKKLKRRPSHRVPSPVVRKIGLRSRDTVPRSGNNEDTEPFNCQKQQKNVERIEFGKYEIPTWYFSPYPEEYACCEKLYICEFCLNYMTQRDTLLRHKARCELRYPPGNEIYRNGVLSMWEVDGRKCPQYCQNLCLIGGFFLKQKTLYFDVEPFFFYVLTEYDTDGCHIIGYFSKMKDSPNDYNLACITTLPPYQNKGYGRFLIEFSYELSKIEDKIGSPEKPLSDFGKLSYVAYWTQVLVEFFEAHQRETFNIMEVSKMTYLTPEDIIETLRINNFLKMVGDSQCTVTIPREAVEKAQEHSRKKALKLDPSLIHWAPFRPPFKKN